MTPTRHSFDTGGVVGSPGMEEADKAPPMEFKKLRARQMFTTAQDFYTKQDYESCIRLLDRSIMFDATMEARKLRAAAQKGTTKGHINIVSMDEGEQVFPISPEMMQAERKTQGRYTVNNGGCGSRTTRTLLGECNAVAQSQSSFPGNLSTSSSFSSTSTTSSEAPFGRMGQGLSRSVSLVMPQTSQMPRATRSDSNLLTGTSNTSTRTRKPSRLTRSQSLQHPQKPRLQWPNRKCSPVSDEVMAIDRKRLRRSHDGSHNGIVGFNSNSFTPSHSRGDITFQDADVSTPGVAFEFSSVLGALRDDASSSGGTVGSRGTEGVRNEETDSDDDAATVYASSQSPPGANSPFQNGSPSFQDGAFSFQHGSPSLPLSIGDLDSPEMDVIGNDAVEHRKQRRSGVRRASFSDSSDSGQSRRRSLAHIGRNRSRISHNMQTPGLPPSGCKAKVSSGERKGSRRKSSGSNSEFSLSSIRHTLSVDCIDSECDFSPENPNVLIRQQKRDLQLRLEQRQQDECTNMSPGPDRNDIIQNNANVIKTNVVHRPVVVSTFDSPSMRPLVVDTTPLGGGLFGGRNVNNSATKGNDSDNDSSEGFALSSNISPFGMSDDVSEGHNADVMLSRGGRAGGVMRNLDRAGGDLFGTDIPPCTPEASSVTRSFWRDDEDSSVKESRNEGSNPNDWISRVAPGTDQKFPRQNNRSRNRNISASSLIPPRPQEMNRRAPPPIKVFATPTREELLMASSSNINVCRQVKACLEGGVRMVAIDFDLTFVRIHTTGRWTKNVTDLCAHVRPVFRRLVPSLIKSGIVVAIVTFSPQEKLIREVIEKVFPDLKLDRDIFVRGSRQHATDDQDETATKNVTPSNIPSSNPNANPNGSMKENLKPDFFFGRRHEQHNVTHSIEKATQQGRLSVCTSDGRVASGVCKGVQKPCSVWSPPSGGKRTHLECVVRFCAKARGESIITHDQLVLIDDDVNNVQAARGDGIRAIRFRALESNIAAEENMLASMAKLGVQGFDEEVMTGETETEEGQESFIDVLVC